VAHLTDYPSAVQAHFKLSHQSLPLHSVLWILSTTNHERPHGPEAESAAIHHCHRNSHRCRHSRGPTAAILDCQTAGMYSKSWKNTSEIFPTHSLTI